MARHIDPQFGAGICVRTPEFSNPRHYVARNQRNVARAGLCGPAETAAQPNTAPSDWKPCLTVPLVHQRYAQRNFGAKSHPPSLLSNDARFSGPTPSASITALTMGSDSISPMLGSSRHQLLTPLRRSAPCDAIFIILVRFYPPNASNDGYLGRVGSDTDLRSMNWDLRGGPAATRDGLSGSTAHKSVEWCASTSARSERRQSR